jgi:hypothetical protein
VVTAPVDWIAGQAIYIRLTGGEWFAGQAELDGSGGLVITTLQGITEPVGAGACLYVSATGTSEPRMSLAWDQASLTGDHSTGDETSEVSVTVTDGTGPFEYAYELIGPGADDFLIVLTGLSDTNLTLDLTDVPGGVYNLELRATVTDSLGDTAQASLPVVLTVAPFYVVITEGESAAPLVPPTQYEFTVGIEDRTGVDPDVRGHGTAESLTDSTPFGSIDPDPSTMLSDLVFSEISFLHIAPASAADLFFELYSATNDVGWYPYFESVEIEYNPGVFVTYTMADADAFSGPANHLHWEWYSRSLYWEEADEGQLRTVRVNVVPFIDTTFDVTVAQLSASGYGYELDNDGTIDPEPMIFGTGGARVIMLAIYPTGVEMYITNGSGYTVPQDAFTTLSITHSGGTLDLDSADADPDASYAGPGESYWWWDTASEVWDATDVSFTYNVTLIV